MYKRSLIHRPVIDRFCDVRYYVHSLIIIFNFMNKGTIIPISEARKRIFDLAEEVQKPGVRFTLTEKGRPKAVFMSAEDFDSLQETLEVLSIFPDLDKDIAQARQDVKSGAYKNFTTLEELLAKDGFVLAEKAKQPYAVHSKAKAKSRKKFE